MTVVLFYSKQETEFQLTQNLEYCSVESLVWFMLKTTNHKTLCK